MYENQTFDTIIQRMLNNVDDDIDKREGSVIYTALAPIALELETYYEALDEVLTETFADTASYYYLAKRAAERNIYPIEATPSTLRMIADPPTAEIEVGDRFTSEDYELTFEVIGGDDVAGSYDIVCLTEGIVGNLESGTLIPVDEINGLESAKIQGAVLYDDKGNKILDDNGNETYKSAVIVPGVDEEDVETFRERYFSSLQSKAFGGNREDYINKIKENRQVGACKVMRSSIAEYVPNEAVNQWIADVAVDSSLSSDVKNWLSAVSSAIKNKTLSSGGTVEVYILDSNMNKPSDELIKELKDTLDPADGGGDGLVPIGHCVHVQGAKLVNIDFDITVSLKQGYSVEDVKDTVKDVIKSALTEYKNEWELNESTELASIQFLTAIYNECSNYITNVSCTLNNGQSVTLDEISVATLGILKINDEVIS